MQGIRSSPYKGLQNLQCMIWFAGIVGMIQSLIWLALTIIGITAYFCVFDRANVNDPSTQAITQHTFYHMYFGDCTPKPDIAFTELDKVTLKLSPNQVNIWIWVYFGIHILWFFSSISLLRKIDKSRLVLLNTILLIWVITTLAISAMDLGLGILFGMDYGDISARASTIAYTNIEGTPAIFLAAMSSSITMMIVSLRGFVIWLINVGLLCYFFVQTFAISKTTTSLTGQDNEGFVSETQSEIVLRQPIDAYSNPGAAEDRNGVPLQLNIEPLKRATVMSVDTLLSRHYQRYPPGNDTKDENSPSEKNGYTVLADTNTFKPYPTVPDPDYSPQMVRSELAVPNQNNNNRPLKSALRNSRFQ